MLKDKLSPIFIGIYVKKSKLYPHASHIVLILPFHEAIKSIFAERESYSNYPHQLITSINYETKHRFYFIISIM